MPPAARRALLLSLRLLLIAAGVGYVLWTVRWRDHAAPGPAGGPPVLREGMLTLLERAEWSWLLVGAAATLVIVPLQSLRWWLLMRCRGLPVSLPAAARLTLTGLFFNVCVPLGSNGGDLVRAVGAARAVGRGRPGVRTTAVVSVLLDRVAGLMGLLVLAALAAPLVAGSDVGRRVNLTVWTLIGAVGLGGFVYLHPLARRVTGIGRLTRRGPLRTLDAAVTGYRGHPGVLAAAVVLSVPVHLALATATALAGYGIGVPTGLITLLAVLPITFLSGALPITVLGLGVMEPTAAALLEGSGITFNQIVAMLMGYRAYLLLYGLLGGLAVLASAGPPGPRDPHDRAAAAQTAPETP